MIGIFDDAGNRLPLVWGTDTVMLYLNDKTDRTGSGYKTDPDNWYRVDSVSLADQLDWVSDPHPTTDGMEAYSARKVQKLIVIEGVIVAESLAKLFDLKVDLATYFDAGYLSGVYGPTESFQMLKFQRPTTDTATWSDGLADLMYVARPRSSTFPISSSVTGNSALFRVELVAADPRCYAQAQSQVIRSGSSSSMIVRSPYSSWPKPIWFKMTGAGSSTFGMRFGTSWPNYCIFDLSGRSNGQVISIYPETRIVTVGTTPTLLYKSGDWNALLIPPGNDATLYFQNTTNISTSGVAGESITADYYKSWVG